MDRDIVKTLKVMCRKDNPQDQKLLLLAELVETKCEALAQHQDSLQKSLDKTNEKLDKVAVLLERIEDDRHSCPVYENKSDFEKISFLFKYPKLSLFMLLGILVLVAGFFGTGIVESIRFIFGV